MSAVNEAIAIVLSILLAGTGPRPLPVDQHGEDLAFVNRQFEALSEERRGWEPPAPTPEPRAYAAAVAPVTPIQEVEYVRLTESEARSALAEAGYSGNLLEQALRVWWGESGRCWCLGKEGDWSSFYGRYLAHGPFQIHWYSEGPWAGWGAYCHLAGRISADELATPQALGANLRCARAINDYDLARGRDPWTQWTVKP